MHQHRRADFGKLLECYESQRKDLKRFFRGKVNESDAEDLVQEVGLQILRYPPREEVQQMDNLLWTIAKRVAIRHWIQKRTDRRNDDLLREAAPADVQGVQGVSDADNAEQGVRQAELQALFSRLPPSQQAVALLRMRGYTLREIALQLNMTTDVVRGEFDRALAFFRKNSGA